MKEGDIKLYKERLLALRARLRGDVSAMADSALRKTKLEASGNESSMPIHMAELGSDNFEQELTLRLMESDEGTLDLIERALERIEDSEFGRCTECSHVIPKARLNVIPYAALCVKCAESLENN